MTDPSLYLDPSSEEQPVEGLVERTDRRKGCLFWGCLGTILFLVLAASILGFFVWKFHQHVLEHTEEESQELPTAQPSVEDVSALEERTRVFEETEGEGVEIVLTADEVNDLLVHAEPDVKGCLWVRFEDARIFIDMAIPFRGRYEGRYLNATVEAKPDVKYGRVSVDVLGATTRAGQEVPAVYLEFFKELAAQNSEEVLESLVQVFGESVTHASSIQVRGGRLVLRK